LSSPHPVRKTVATNANKKNLNFLTLSPLEKFSK